VHAFPPPRELETIVVDNASGDGSADMVRRLFPHVKVLQNRNNRGFSAAFNRGIRNASGSVLLALNPDVILSPGCVESLAEFLDRHPDVGICGPRLLNPDGSMQLSCRAFPTLLNVFFGRRSIWNRLFPENRMSRSFLKADLDYSVMQEVDWLAGACMMIRRKVVESIGLFDEDYFLYAEDTDYCYRAREKGFRVFFFPGASATHERGAATRKAFVSSMYNHNLSMYKFFCKHYHLSLPVRTILGLGLAVRVLLVVTAEGILRSL
jgi:GT2 family glycosyltransferase